MNWKMYATGKWVAFGLQTVTTSLLIRKWVEIPVQKLEIVLLVYGLSFVITYLLTLLEYGYVEHCLFEFIQKVVEGELQVSDWRIFLSRTIPMLPIIAADIGSTTWGLDTYFSWYFSLAIGFILFPMVEILGILEKKAREN